MGKFKLFYSSQQIVKWKEKYIDYNFLKQKIHKVKIDYYNSNIFDIFDESDDDISSKSYEKSDTSSTCDADDDIMNKVKGLKDFNEFLSAEKGYLIQEFFTCFNQEIKKVYLHYLNDIELDLFRNIKAVLIQKEQYSIMTTYQLYQESIALKNILNDTIEAIQYVSMNMNCVKRLCNTIDKHLVRLFNKGSISLKFLRTKLELPNSDFGYIVQYKIIDEASAIVDHLIRKIMKFVPDAYYFEDDNKRPNADMLIEESSSSLNLSEKLNNSTLRYSSDMTVNRKNALEEDREKDKDSVIFVSEKVGKRALKNKINKVYSDIKVLLMKINDSSKQFRIKFKNYPILIRYGFKAINYSNLSSGLQLEEDTTQWTHINSVMDEELLIKKFITKEAFKEYISYWKANYSKANAQNLNLILIHTLLSTWVYIISVFNPFYCQNLSQFKLFLQTFVFLHIGKMASTFVFGFYLHYKNMFKITVFFSCVAFLIGQNLFVIKQIFKAQITNDIHNVFLYVSKFIIGIGSSKLLNSKYMLTYCSSPLLKETLSKYKLYHNLGQIMGYIVIGIAYLLFDKTMILYYIDIVSAFFIIIFLVFFMIYFTNPGDPQFSLQREDNESLLSRSLSISKRKTITKEEGEKLQLANRVIHKQTQVFNYSNQNLVQETIQHLVNRQRDKFSYLKKAFCALIFLIFFNSYLPIYSLVLFIFFGSKQNKGIFTILFCFICSSSYITHFFLLSRFKCKISQKRVILIAQIYQVAFGAMIGLIHYDSSDFLFIAVLITFLMLLCSCFIEKEIDRLLKKIVPQNFNLFSFNSCLYLTLLESVSTIMVSFSIYWATEWKFTEGSSMDWTELLISIAIVSYPYLLSLIITVISYRYLEPKAIAKIYKKNVYQ